MWLFNHISGTKTTRQPAGSEIPWDIAPKTRPTLRRRLCEMRNSAIISQFPHPIRGQRTFNDQAPDHGALLDDRAKMIIRAKARTLSAVTSRLGWLMCPVLFVARNTCTFRPRPVPCIGDQGLAPWTGAPEEYGRTAGRGGGFIAASDED